MAPLTREQCGIIRGSKPPPPPPPPPSDATEMSPAIWSSLPLDLLDRILSLLPLPSILSLRSTCKRIRSLLLSPPFLAQLRPRIRRQAAYLLLCHPQFSSRHIPLYDFSSDSWRKLPIPIAPPSPRHLASSSSGLLCFSLSHPSSLVVCNLLTLALKSISAPAQSSGRRPILISKPSPRPHGYKIFLPSSSSAAPAFFLYDSDSNSWTDFPLPSVADSQDGGPVLFSNRLYFTTPEPFSIVAFDLTAGKWETEAVALDLPPDLAFVRLVSGGEGESLYLVGGEGRYGIARSLKVWELVGSGRGRRWEEAGRLPEAMCRKLGSVCYHNYSHVYCVWHQGVVCVCCTTWPEVLLFRLGRGTWHWLPKCPLLEEKWCCGFQWFSFSPDLCAMV